MPASPNISPTISPTAPKTRTTADFYRIPRYYDILHAPGTAGDLTAMERIEQRFVPSPRRSQGGAWLEPACGTGRYLILAARRAVRAKTKRKGRSSTPGPAKFIGFDLEPEMVAFAQTRINAPDLSNRVRVFQADMRSFDRVPGEKIPPISFAFNLINTIRHLPSDDAMLEHFEAIARVLTPGGVYAVGVSLASYGNEFETEDVWKGSRGTCRVTQVVQYIPPPGKYGGHRQERVLSHLTILRPGKPDEHVDSTYTLRSYNLSQWESLIGRSALETVGVVDHDGNDTKAVEPGYAIHVLRRRAQRPKKRTSKKVTGPRFSEGP